MKRYKIGEAARLLGLTTQALRFYEKEGVIKPRKSENGTRYYDVGDIVRLLSFKKYRQAELSVQEIVAHFRANELALLTAQMDAQSELLEQRAAQLIRRAQAIRRFERLLSDTRRELDRPIPCTLPRVYLLDPPLDALDSADEDVCRALNAYVDAMPDVNIVFVQPAADRAAALHLAAIEQVVEAWGLPVERAEATRPAPAVRLSVRTPLLPWSPEQMEQMRRRVAEAGFRPDPAHGLLGVHLASETLDGVVYLYARFYVPILTDEQN